MAKAFIIWNISKKKTTNGNNNCHCKNCRAKKLLKAHAQA